MDDLHRTTSVLRVVVQSESQPVARALRAALRHGGWEVHLHASPATLAASAGQLRATVALVVVMTAGAALAMTREVRALTRICPVVFVSPRDEARPHAVLTVLREGAAGWLTTDLDPLRLPSALSVVMRGEPALPRHVVASLVEELRQERAGSFVGPEGTVVELTRRESEAARLVTRGISTATAARLMNVSPTTVRGYLASARRKLGVSRREDLADRLGETERTIAITAG